MKAMILAAGLGTRFKPWTDKHPKALAVISGKSLLQRNIEFLQTAGIYDVVVNIHHFADQIEEAVKANKGWGSNVILSDERDVVLETGGGLMKASKHLSDDSFVLMNVDILTTLNLGAMIESHMKLMPLATLATTNRKTSRYFIFDHLLHARFLKICFLYLSVHLSLSGRSSPPVHSPPSLSSLLIKKIVRLALL